MFIRDMITVRVLFRYMKLEFFAYLQHWTFLSLIPVSCSFAVLMRGNSNYRIILIAKN